MSEKQRIEHLVKTFGVEKAKEKAQEYVDVYCLHITHPDKKMSMYFKEMLSSIEEFLRFIHAN